MNDDKTKWVGSMGKGLWKYNLKLAIFSAQTAKQWIFIKSLHRISMPLRLGNGKLTDQLRSSSLEIDKYLWTFQVNALWILIVMTRAAVVLKQWPITLYLFMFHRPLSILERYLYLCWFEDSAIKRDMNAFYFSVASCSNPKWRSWMELLWK